MSKLSDNLRRARQQAPVAATSSTPTRREPVWKGPTQDGITYSLLSRYLTCRERFRIMVVEGLLGADSFSAPIEFGDMWHVMEKALAGGEALQVGGTDHWQYALKERAATVARRYSTQQADVGSWYEVAKLMFPLYVSYWSMHPDVRDRTPLLQEQVFSIPHDLPSGRAVRLRGRWDSVDVIGRGRTAGVYLQENKTKGEIREGQLVRQLSFDLQTMLYLVALGEYQRTSGLYSATRLGIRGGPPILGVRYNVIRRPRQYQGRRETRADFLSRLQGIIKEDPAVFFMRWKVEILPTDVVKFRHECLDPLLENLCDDWEWWEYCHRRGGPAGGGPSVFDGQRRAAEFPRHSPHHYRHPFGVRNILDEGGCTDLDNYLSGGGEVGLRRVDQLFRELDQD